MDGFERGDVYLLQHAAVRQHIHRRRTAINISAVDIPTRSKRREFFKSGLAQEVRLASAIREPHPVNGSEGHIAAPQLAVDRISAWEHAVDHFKALIKCRRVPVLRRIFHSFRNVLFSEFQQNLAGAHQHAPEKSVHLIFVVHIQDVFPGADQLEIKPGPVRRLKHQRRAEGAKVRIQAVNGVVEIGVMQQGQHAPRHFIQPFPGLMLLGRLLILQGYFEPRPHGTGHAALHPGGQGTHVQNARGVHDLFVEYFRFAPRVRVHVRPELERQEMPREIVPSHVP